MTDKLNPALDGERRCEASPVARRDFLLAAAAGGAALLLPNAAHALGKALPYKLPPLPYPEQALAPIMSANTISFHYGKHHKGYVDKLNGMLEKDPLGDLTLEEVIKATAGKPDKAGIFNNAAQIWNHNLFWASLKPGGSKPSGALKERLDADLGGLDKFRQDFAAAAIAQFGSGWAWLVLDEGKLKIVKTSNAETPLTQGKTCLLTLDVWEHAYYLDYQNKRAEYVNAVIDKLLNWDFAAQQFAASQPGKGTKR